MNTLKRRSCALLISLLAIPVLVAGCGSSSDGAEASPPTTGEPSAAVVIHIKDYAYDPDRADVEAGQEVTFVNDDDVDHTATANDKSFDTGVIAAGESKTITIKAGVVGADSYYCTIHDYMKATVKVGG